MEHDILIVEDEPFFARMCAKALARSGRWVRVASNGKEAIEEIRKRKPDLMILDLLMPEVDGFSVIGWLRHHPAEFPVIVLSNLDDSDETDLPGHMGVAEYCVKSDTPLSLLAKIVDEHLGRVAVR